MESVLQNRVMKVVRNLSGEIEQETGVQSSLEENELKDYVQMAIQEMRSKKNSLKQLSSSESISRIFDFIL
jgi:hypothetical protein